MSYSQKKGSKMKNLSKILMVTLLVFAVGCGKNKKKAVKSQASTRAELSSVGHMDEYVFDDNTGDVKEFDFVNSGKKSKRAVKGSESDIADQLLKEDLEQELAFTEYKDDDSDDYEFTRINFELNDNKIKGHQQDTLHDNIERARKAVSVGKKIEVRAYCCELGPSDYNMALSQRRANAIKREMVEHGIPSKKINSIGRGQEYPIAWSNAEDKNIRVKELSPNRRAEILAS